MSEDKPRIQKVLAYLYDAEELARPKEIADALGETPLNVGKDLHRLKERGLAESEGEGLWKITSEGREWLEGGAERERGEREGEKGKGKDTAETVPSQSDLFKSIGEKLGIGSRKGDIRLDAITYYVQRTANLDSLTSVWNALTEMGVANDVKKRWVKIYAQNLPGKEIPEELREKLEGGEPERIKAEPGEISAKPKRFSVISGEIVGDPEGDYTFKEALQYIAQQKGASPDEASSMALELSKMGPEMLTTVLGTITPLISKESPRSDMDTILKLTEAGLLKKPGDDASSPTIRALETQVKELRESLHKQELDTMRNAIISVSNQVGELRKEMSNQGQLEGRYALMKDAMEHVDKQVTGLRSDARPLIDTLARGGGRVEPTRRSPEERAKIAHGLKVAVAQESDAHALENHLLFGEPLPEGLRRKIHGEELAPPPAEPAPAPEPAPALEPQPITYME